MMPCATFERGGIDYNKEWNKKWKGISAVSAAGFSVGAALRKENRLKSKIIQFSYEHQKLEKELKKVRRSTNEIVKMLDGISEKPEKEAKNKKN